MQTDNKRPVSGKSRRLKESFQICMHYSAYFIITKLISRLNGMIKDILSQSFLHVSMLVSSKRAVSDSFYWNDKLSTSVHELREFCMVNFSSTMQLNCEKFFFSYEHLQNCLQAPLAFAFMHIHLSDGLNSWGSEVRVKIFSWYSVHLGETFVFFCHNSETDI